VDGSTEIISLIEDSFKNVTEMDPVAASPLTVR
jgi:hypothetical protein